MSDIRKLINHARLQRTRLENMKGNSNSKHLTSKNYSNSWYGHYHWSNHGVILLWCLLCFCLMFQILTFFPPIGSILWATHRFWEYVLGCYFGQPLPWLVCAMSIPKSWWPSEASLYFSFMGLKSDHRKSRSIFKN